MKGRTFIHPDTQQLCTSLVREITSHLRGSTGRGEACVALSGGSTPVPFFRQLATVMDDPSCYTVWSRVHFFWVDERCVPPDHADSNYRSVREHLFMKQDIDGAHIHRILGENDPDEEAGRYSGEVLRIVPHIGGWPSFDWILLGLGSDGHTASIFPDRMDLMDSDRLFEHVHHPKTGQPRITMTPRLINNAGRVSFMVTGTSKHAILHDLAASPEDAVNYPADMIHPVHGLLEWWMDEEAETTDNHGK